MGKRVIQLFTKSDVLTKVQQRAGGPRAVQTWRDEVIASNGYLDGETLKLNSQAAGTQKVDQCDIVVLQDEQADVVPNPQQGAPFSVCHFLRFGRFWRTDEGVGFILQQGEHGIQLVLHDDPALGRPRRGYFPVADLRLNEPVLVSLNHKSDFSMSSRRARTYWYGQFLFVYCGECTRIELYDESGVWTTKLVPWRAAKHVDLNKRLL